eukprot:m.121658 g.121658  ORF g.121658 m.121658 type:complete len:735 (+) comp15647_c0_seq2:55-2259(+)
MAGRVTVPTYDDDIGRCGKFLREFQGNSSETTTGLEFKYLEQIQEVVNRTRSVIEIQLDDVAEHDADFMVDIQKNTRRYVHLFSSAIDSVAKDLQPAAEVGSETPLDIFIQQRILLAEQAAQAAGEAVNIEARYPPALLRRYNVVFLLPSMDKTASIRNIEARHIGSLVKVEGIVTRATAVKPLMTVATYSCNACDLEVFQEITSPNFMPMHACESQVCKEGRRKGQLQLITRGSKFERFQELKIQEMARHVPTGHIPRSLTVYVRGDGTRIATPGDQITVTGVFLPVPYSGYRAIRAGLLSDTFLEAHHIHKAKKTYQEQTLTDEMREEIEEKAASEEMYDTLSASIAPEIYGHDDIKKALLLLLVGGVSRKLPDGMSIRGDINILLMGDPGVAKSQLLKKVVDLAPRAVYTTGRGSSGVGLTAAVTRDPLTNELILEGGALVMADMGVCCIDEFDKMEEGDRTAIHEVMEQQTISIAKAGITTTLNARSAILAAANPVYGRYNIKKTPTQNINLPDALRSRFDLVFLLLDRPDMEADLRLAQHITYVHANNDFPELTFQPLEKEFVRNYVALAKGTDPYVSPELAEEMALRYAKLREDALSDPNEGHITARMLLAMLRLSTALARLRFSDEVVMDDFEEALRLMESCKASVRDAHDTRQAKRDPTTEIYSILKNIHLKTKNVNVSMEAARNRVVKAGYTEPQLKACIKTYEELNVIFLNTPGTRITFVDGGN